MARKIDDRRLAAILAELDRLTNWENRPRHDMRVGLEPMLDLCGRLGRPQEGFRSIHVAGTKGKGSTSALIEAALAHAGFAVGRYGSPHVEHIGERFTVGGKPVSEAVLADALEPALAAYRSALEEGTAASGATWFDLLTVAAFLIFAGQKLDWAVVEVGLGGRLDSTNVLASEVAIITNIGLEHTEILGHTRAEIAAEKAGIIKPGTVVVTPLAADDEAGRVVAERAAATGCPLLRAHFPFDATIEEQNVAVASRVLEALAQKGIIASAGKHAGRPLGAWLLDGEVRARARLPGRLERYDVPVESASSAVPVILDGAHVPFNLAAVLHDITMDRTFARPGIAVLALAADKDAQGMLEILARYPLKLIFADLGSSVRVRSARQLQELALSMGIEGRVIADPERAFAAALSEAAADGGWVLATGSLHLVGILRPGVTSRAVAS